MTDTLENIRKNSKDVVNELKNILDRLENGTTLEELVNDDSVKKMGDFLESTIPLTQEIDVVDTDKVEQVVETIQKEE